MSVAGVILLLEYCEFYCECFFFYVLRTATFQLAKLQMAIEGEEEDEEMKSDQYVSINYISFVFAFARMNKKPKY